MIEVSVVMAARGRYNETKRTLQSYTKLTYPNWELIFMNPVENNPMEFNLYGLFLEFKDRLPIEFHQTENTLTPAQTWNEGINLAHGRFVITCSADILLTGGDLLQRYLDQYRDIRESVLVYKLSRSATKNLDGIDWYNRPDTIQELMDFWSAEIDGELNRTRKQAGLTTYHTGMTAERWKWFGGFRTEHSFYVNDSDIVEREKNLGGCDTIQGYWAVHQAHPQENYSYPPLNTSKWVYENELQSRLLEPAKEDTRSFR